MNKIYVIIGIVLLIYSLYFYMKTRIENIKTRFQNFEYVKNILWRPENWKTENPVQFIGYKNKENELCLCIKTKGKKHWIRASAIEFKERMIILTSRKDRSFVFRLEERKKDIKYTPLYYAIRNIVKQTKAVPSFVT